VSLRAAVSVCVELSARAARGAQRASGAGPARPARVLSALRTRVLDEAAAAWRVTRTLGYGELDGRRIHARAELDLLGRTAAAGAVRAAPAGSGAASTSERAHSSHARRTTMDVPERSSLASAAEPSCQRTIVTRSTAHRATSRSPPLPAQRVATDPPAPLRTALRAMGAITMSAASASGIADPSAPHKRTTTRGPVAARGRSTRVNAVATGGRCGTQAPSAGGRGWRGLPCVAGTSSAVE
jgi:hypothetical protein